VLWKRLDFLATRVPDSLVNRLAHRLVTRWRDDEVIKEPVQQVEHPLRLVAAHIDDLSLVVFLCVRTEVRALAEVMKVLA
jgi:hypothetical protein